MDPISAVSFAASIVTFIDLASKVVSGAFEVLSSGQVLENAHVAAVVDDLTTATKQFANPPGGLFEACRGFGGSGCGMPKYRRGSPEAPEDVEAQSR
ncbi:hypothetical protein N656DRAFT_783187 [Canariomyces notabilis]|uniref:Fungal N-terminal domain-containing protein n=1 Tax=Canariomyces notabilis TaxID=2074819 RepID=A0AAN6QGM6_9PEZI|nr:hypothetical protein N656DRAFT_783187 [Canariomyces arenarius]